jgi:hypothetical protein
VNETLAALETLGPGILDAVLIDADIIKPRHLQDYHSTAKWPRAHRDNGRVAAIGYAELTRRIVSERSEMNG